MKLEVVNGSFRYGQKEIIRNVSFPIDSGEVLAVLGQNGIGKTTLLRCTMGMLRWSTGRTMLDGKDLRQYSDKELWKRIAYVPQAKNNIADCTVEEMVLLGRSAHLGLFQQPRREDREIAEKALAFVGMEKVAGKHCTKISGGELQMVLIARALAGEPEVLVLDEPESNLDFRNQILVLDTISKLAKESGIAAIINTHYPVHALKISDKALILNDDLSNLFGKTENLINEKNLSMAFHVDVRIGENSYDGHSYKSVIPIRIQEIQ